MVYCQVDRLRAGGYSRQSPQIRSPATAHSRLSDRLRHLSARCMMFKGRSRRTMSPEASRAARAPPWSGRTGSARSAAAQPPLRVAPSPVSAPAVNQWRFSAMQKLRIVTIRVWPGRLVLERWINPSRSRRTCSPRYGRTNGERSPPEIPARNLFIAVQHTHLDRCSRHRHRGPRCRVSLSFLAVLPVYMVDERAKVREGFAAQRARLPPRAGCRLPCRAAAVSDVDGEFKGTMC
jgi:hypothetical protein